MRMATAFSEKKDAIANALLFVLRLFIYDIHGKALHTS
jgi:hypothetical protein